MTVKTQTFDCEEPMDMREEPVGSGPDARKKPSKIKASRAPGKSILLYEFDSELK